MPEFTVFKGSKDGSIIKSTTKKELGADEVLIRVTHSGLCGTDQHYRNADQGLGHEGAGVIEEVGSAVTTFKRGDSAGWGYIHNSCNHCKQCITGHETLCPERAMYGYADLDQGSFASHAIWKADYIFQIPESIPREYAAPLMCGGATVFAAMRSANTQPTDVVGIIGIGGLGHLAIQFASKMGCKVVVFSSTESKKAEAMKLGADEFIVTKGVKVLPVSSPLDRLFVCASFQPDWEQFLPAMAPHGIIFPITVASDDLKIPYMSLLANELRIYGAIAPGRQVHRDMLDFAAHHKIRPIIEEFPMSCEGIEESMKKLRDGKMRYRGVIVA